MHANLPKNNLAGTTGSPKMLEAMFSIGIFDGAIRVSRWQLKSEHAAADVEGACAGAVSR